MKNAYVYIYFDPRDYVPFYVGIGVSKRRHLYHLHEAMSRPKSHKTNNPVKFNKIKKILDRGEQPIIQKVAEDLSWEEAGFLEMFLIKTIGRRDKKEGPLTNLTDGGDGTKGHIYKHSEETKRKISEGTKGKSGWLKGKKMPEEMREKLKAARKKNPESPAKGKKWSEEAKRRLSESRKGVPKSEDHRRKISEGRRATA